MSSTVAATENRTSPRGMVFLFCAAAIAWCSSSLLIQAAVQHAGPPRETAAAWRSASRWLTASDAMQSLGAVNLLIAGIAWTLARINMGKPESGGAGTIPSLQGFLSALGGLWNTAIFVCTAGVIVGGDAQGVAGHESPLWLDPLLLVLALGLAYIALTVGMLQFVQLPRNPLTVLRQICLAIAAVGVCLWIILGDFFSAFAPSPWWGWAFVETATIIQIVFTAGGLGLLGWAALSKPGLNRHLSLLVILGLAGHLTVRACVPCLGPLLATRFCECRRCDGWQAARQRLGAVPPAESDLSRGVRRGLRLAAAAANSRGGDARATDLYHRGLLALSRADARRFGRRGLAGAGIRSRTLNSDRLGRRGGSLLAGPHRRSPVGASLARRREQGADVPLSLRRLARSARSPRRCT